MLKTANHKKNITGNFDIEQNQNSYYLKSNTNILTI